MLTAKPFLEWPSTFAIDHKQPEIIVHELGSNSEDESKTATCSTRCTTPEIGLDDITPLLEPEPSAAKPTFDVQGPDTTPELGPDNVTALLDPETLATKLSFDDQGPDNTTAETDSKDSESGVPTTQEPVVEMAQNGLNTAVLDLVETNLPYPHTIKPSPLDPSQQAHRIIDVLEQYRMHTSKSILQKWAGRSRVNDQVLGFIRQDVPVKLVLPAFPFKSPNRLHKTLGSYPDKAEEIALQHMEGLCKMIKDIYPRGAELCVVSDGLMYNGEHRFRNLGERWYTNQCQRLTRSDEEVWTYGTALRELANAHECSGIKFYRLTRLLSTANAENSKQFCDQASHYRQELLDRFLPKDFDVDAFIKTDADAILTYRGYNKFLETDLQHDSRLAGKSQAQKSKFYQTTARNMMVRGRAFALAVADAFSKHIRLSIHPSANDAAKLSVSLLPQTGPKPMTPWHASMVRAVDGTLSLAHAATVPALTHELVWENGRPSYFREKSDLFDWPGMEVSFEYLYPTGIIVRPVSRKPYSLQEVRMQKVRGLAEKCSPIILRGFKDTTEERIFKSKAYDLGDVLPWTFGVMQKVKDAGKTDRQANNVVTSEAMPMHYDGMFKFTKKVHLDGSETMESTPPRFQYFVAQSTAPRGSGYTLFAASRLVFQHLPRPYSLEELDKLTWDCQNSGFWDCHMQKLPLIVRHPTSGEPCVRWHEPWPVWKTDFAHAIVTIENGSQEYARLIDRMLYDRRVCLYFEWDHGDVVVSDNTNMMHTRSAFDGSSARELWRIHFD